MAYKPRPIDTSRVTLSEDVLELTELLAKNTHEIWAQQRLSEHWCYGAQRDDERLEHPGLVSYEELSEVEKQYDRNTALETLKTIISLGYHIESPAHSANAAASDTHAILETLKQPGALTLNALLTMWQERVPSRWARSAELYQRLSTRFLKLGELFLTHDVVSEGLKFWPGDLRLRQLQALALARVGATAKRANAMLTAFYEEGERDEETIGILARTHKDLWLQASDPVERERQLQQSYKCYAEAYQLSGGYWTGINAATLALLSGRRDQARALAAEVRELCFAELRRAEEIGGDRYWTLATLGEAALIMEDWVEAARRYDEAVTNASRQLGILTSTRRNARLIIEYLGGDLAFIERHLPVPKVVVFGGSNAAGWQVPAGMEAAVRQVILERLTELGAGIGYAAVPSPGDAPFLEAMLEAGGETHVVLPCELGELLKAEDGDDELQTGRGTRYESVLGRVTSVTIASEQNMTVGSMSGEYSRLMLHGLALIRAEQLDTELITLALLDGYTANEGQHASAVSPLEASDERVELIDLSGILPPPLNVAPPVAGLAPEARADAATDFKVRMAALLFADAVNFSKLTDAQIPVFVQHFLGAVGSLIARFQPAPLFKNTWGDGLYLVFVDVQAAGRFALDLSDLLNATDWTLRGLPADLNLRIALHAGPVYGCTDPVTEKDNFIGTHVSRAARLEPITPPGQVYASREFAALVAAGRVRDFTCDYVGQTPLAKKYGTFPTYHVRRTQNSDG